MPPRGAVTVLLTGLLAGVLIASGATSAVAPRHEGSAVKKTISARLAPPLVTVGEPASVVAQLTPAVAGATVTVEQVTGGTTADLGTATTDAAGRAVLALDTSTAGARSLRVTSGSRPPATATLTVSDGTACTPTIPLVDLQATPAARCLAAKLDHWKAAGLMGVGQQLNVSTQDYLAPLTALGPRRVSVVGFDLEELATSGTYEYPFQDQAISDLTALADQGAVLSASWHATNPHTGGSYGDRSWHNLGALLDPTTPEYATFWADFDAKMALLHRFQDAGVPVVFRPFHEANGDWFWWGHPDPATYKKLWAAMQKRAWTVDDVHNIVWAYSFNWVSGKNIVDPVKLLPAHVDVAGIDAYDPEKGKGNAPDGLPMTGYSAVAAKVKRMALTEAGPYDSTNGAWNPATLARVARAQKSKPLWSMLWFDDSTGKKQISSLHGGLTWLDSCTNAFCYLK